jgi:phospholipid-binding lipoprotein MlaA
LLQIAFLNAIRTGRKPELQEQKPEAADDGNLDDYMDEIDQ